MELMIDCVDLGKVKKAYDNYPITGITSNPTIIKEVGVINVSEYFHAIRRVVGKQASIHIQVVEAYYEGIVQEALEIERVYGNENIYVKIPVTIDGLRAIKYLKSQGLNITATAIYTKRQGFLAMLAGADYIAPYFGRIERMGNDASSYIVAFRKFIDDNKLNVKILAASFRTAEQVENAIQAGADAVTVKPDFLDGIINIDTVNEALEVFSQDWQDSQHRNTLF